MEDRLTAEMLEYRRDNQEKLKKAAGGAATEDWLDSWCENWREPWRRQKVKPTKGRNADYFKIQLEAIKKITRTYYKAKTAEWSQTLSQI